MRARLRVRITPDDVGSRVSVRLADEAGGYTDVVGHLEAWADGQLRVRRRDGEVATLSEADLVAGKVVPPAPPQRR